MREKIIVPGYKIVRLLAEGGMGDVYVAEKEDIGKRCAVKILSSELAKREDFVRRFFREARVLAQLSHPHIVPIIDIGKTTGGRYFIVMEYLEGKTVEELINEKGRMSEDEALRLVMQVADALEYANARNIVHRDIKPSNIIVDGDGCARLCDFGLSKPIGGSDDITLMGLIMGTPEYLSPEQAHGRVDIDIRSDIYSLGASLYHMVVGRPPFEGRIPQETAAKHITDEVKFPVDVNITPATRSLILWMMRKSPDERPSNPTIVKESIQRILSGKTHSALASTTAAVLLRIFKKRLKQLLDSRLALTITAAIIAGFLVLLGLLLRG